MKKNNKRINKVFFASVLGILIMLMPMIAFANPNPVGNAESWITGQLQSGVRIGVAIGVVALVFTKKLTSSLPWFILITIAAFVLWNLDTTITFLGDIGRLIIR